MKDAAIEKAIKDKAELAKAYNVPVSAVVWIGNNKYIVVTEKGEIKI
jgi:hypothetical protein